MTSKVGSLLVLRAALSVCCVAVFAAGTGCASRLERSFGDIVQREVTRSVALSDVCDELVAAAPSSAYSASEWFAALGSPDSGISTESRRLQAGLRSSAEASLQALVGQLPTEVGASCDVAGLAAVARGQSVGCAAVLGSMVRDWNQTAPADAMQDSLRSLVRQGEGSQATIAAVAEGILATATRLDFSAPLLNAILRALDATSESLDRFVEAIPYGRTFGAVLRPPLERLLARSLAWSLERLVLRPGTKSGTTFTPAASISRSAMAVHSCEVLAQGAPRSRLSRLYLENVVRSAAGEAVTLPTSESACAAVTTWPARTRCHTNWNRLDRLARNTAVALETERVCGPDADPACAQEVRDVVYAPSNAAAGGHADTLALDAFDVVGGGVAGVEAITETLRASLQACPAPCSGDDVATVGGILLREGISREAIAADPTLFQSWMVDELAATRIELAGLRGDVAEVRDAVSVLERRIESLHQASDARLRSVEVDLGAARGSLADLERMLGRLDGACGTQIDRVIQARSQLVGALSLCVASASRAVIEQSSTLVEMFGANGAVPECASCPLGMTCATDPSTGNILFVVSIASLRSLDAPVQISVLSDGMFDECIYDTTGSAFETLLAYLRTHPVAGRSIAITGAIGWSDMQRPGSSCSARVEASAAASAACATEGADAERADERVNRQLACLRAETVWERARAAGVAGSAPLRPLAGRVDTTCTEGDRVCYAASRRVELSVRVDGRGAELPLSLDYDSCR